MEENSGRFVIAIQDVKIKNFSEKSLSLKHDTEVGSHLSFGINGTVDAKKKEVITLHVDGNLEFKGKIETVQYDKDADLTIVNAYDRIPKVKYQWAFDFVPQWGGGVLILFALVCNRTAGLGFILLNFGFFLYQKPVTKKKEA